MSTKDRRQVVKDGQNLVNVVCERSPTGGKENLVTNAKWLQMTTQPTVEYTCD